MAREPLIVGLGGTTSAGSSTHHALGVAVASAERLGARVRMFDGTALARWPHYAGPDSVTEEIFEFLAAVREADGLIIASPGYHGSISGLIKNALDYLEETARDERTYLDGVPVGLIATAYGWQATGSTLAALRSIVHALRGWPTPFGAAINTSGGTFRDGVCVDDMARDQLGTVGRQVVDFAQLRIDQKPDQAAATG